MSHTNAVTDWVSGVDEIHIEPTPPCIITFHAPDGAQIAELNWTDGTMRFAGSTDEAAKLFFDGFIGLVDSAINQRMKEATYAK